MTRTVRAAVTALFVGAVVFGVVALIATDEVAAKGGKGGGGSGCPRVGIACLDVWDPVICDDGHVYSNACYAYVACATGCVPYGDGGPVEAQ